MTITVFIRYEIDPFKKELFETYARRWLAIIPRCGGGDVHYWMPHEGSNRVAFGLIWTSPVSVESVSLCFYPCTERCFERCRADVAEARVASA
jgi:NIPSNAP